MDRVVFGDFRAVFSRGRGLLLERSAPAAVEGAPTGGAGVAASVGRGAWDGRGEVPLRRPPSRSHARAVGTLVGRESQLQAVRGAVRTRAMIEFTGESGSGKTALLHAIGPDAYIRVGALGVVDFLHELVGEFHVPPLDGRRLTAEECVDALRRVEAVVALDDVSFDREAIALVRRALPGCAVLVAAARPVIGLLGASHPLPGLADADALALLARDTGRMISPGELPAVHRLVAAVSGNPLALCQAAALVRHRGYDLATVAEIAETGTWPAPAAATTGRHSRPAPADRRRTTPATRPGGTAAGPRHADRGARSPDHPPHPPEAAAEASPPRGRGHAVPGYGTNRAEPTRGPKGDFPYGPNGREPGYGSRTADGGYGPGGAEPPYGRGAASGYGPGGDMPAYGQTAGPTYGQAAADAPYEPGGADASPPFGSSAAGQPSPLWRGAVGGPGVRTGPAALADAVLGVLAEEELRALAVLVLTDGAALPLRLARTMARVRGAAPFEELVVLGLAVRHEDRVALRSGAPRQYEGVATEHMDTAGALDAMAEWISARDPGGLDVPGKLRAALALLAHAARKEEWAAAQRLAACVEKLPFLRGQWQAWQAVLDSGRAAAERTASTAAAAYFTHQLGTLHALEGRTDEARTFLAHAFDLRIRVADTAGAEISRANLRLLGPDPSDTAPARPAPPAERPRRRRTARVMATAAVLALGVGTGAVLSALSESTGSDTGGGNPPATSADDQPDALDAPPADPATTPYTHPWQSMGGQGMP